MSDDQTIIANLPVIYANNIRLGMALTDFRLFIGETLPAGPPPTNPPGMFVGGNVQQVDRLCIVLSPDLIPSLIEGLTKAIKLYETNFGPLRKPPQGTPNLTLAEDNTPK